MMLPWKKRNRRQPKADGPSLLERVNWRMVGIAAGTVAGCVALALLLALALDRPVQRVLVEGSFQRVSPPEIEAAVVEVARGGLASVDLDEVRTRIEGIDWVDHAVVQRRWPNALRVVIVEQVLRRWAIPIGQRHDGSSCATRVGRRAAAAQGRTAARAVAIVPGRQDKLLGADRASPACGSQARPGARQQRRVPAQPARSHRPPGAHRSPPLVASARRRSLRGHASPIVQRGFELAFRPRVVQEDTTPM
jgi:hypothetical protein